YIPKNYFSTYWGYERYANSIPSTVPVWDPIGEGVLSYRRMNLAYRESGRTVKNTCPVGNAFSEHSGS
ncbi:hypothetical protein, partial [Clostridium sp. D5]|uniref:hypothetical protein n=1 Tax=Clostridium sp. D5 TaxID=556261 RepID=UPI001A99C27A